MHIPVWASPAVYFSGDKFSRISRLRECYLRGDFISQISLIFRVFSYKFTRYRANVWLFLRGGAIYLVSSTKTRLNSLLPKKILVISVNIPENISHLRHHLSLCRNYQQSPANTGNLLQFLYISVIVVNNSGKYWLLESTFASICRKLTAFTVDCGHLLEYALVGRNRAEINRSYHL